MIIPVGDHNVVGGARPFFTYAFILINVLIFGYQITLNHEEIVDFFHAFGTVPSEIVQGQHFYTLFTSMFLHGGFGHLLGNMLFLWIFGDNVEAVMGNFRYLIFYIVAGLIATLTHVWMNSQTHLPSVGASGAISAILGAYLIMFPRSQIKLVFIFFFITFYVSAILFIGLWFLEQFMSVYAETGNPDAPSQGVAWWAHIGGFIFGVIIGLRYRTRARTYDLSEGRSPLFR